jgi:hypothetical protein
MKKLVAGLVLVVGVVLVLPNYRQSVSAPAKAGAGASPVATPSSTSTLAVSVKALLAKAEDPAFARSLKKYELEVARFDQTQENVLAVRAEISRRISDSGNAGAQEASRERLQELFQQEVRLLESQKEQYLALQEAVSEVTRRSNAYAAKWLAARGK